MTTQEYQFCENYALNGGNGKRAAIAAGYPETEAQATAAELLKRDDIQAELALYAEPVVIDPPAYWEARAEFGD
jgi:phage terminase small subunit